MNTLPKRRLSSLLITGVALSLLGTGTANAATPVPAPAAEKASNAERAAAAKEVAQGSVQAPPRGKAAATHNPLYKTGVLPTLKCSPGGIRKGSSASYRQFMTRVNTCLNNAWKRQFKKARLSFSKPRLRFVTKSVKSPCGGWPTGAAGMYCSANRTMYIAVTKQAIREGFALGAAKLMAHEYAHHVQTISGIGPNYYFPSYHRARGKARLELSRRFELQADCMSTAFLRSVRSTLPVRAYEWEGMLDWIRQNGHKTWPQNDHGKGYSQVYWAKRGYSSGGLRMCNTWTAPDRRVA
ncbi:neutral zinc metallopeptidase [Thermostaphylospora chromogena]|uniref:Neutral zinc metallopeptidase n=1 Tax=Thermostaphylospora chromogena TaxID=35622 RepID=A0A1H1HXE3_9ACTN|nr:neutral zinc metallopeptidase [Thermostaphylospora chromogena]SDR30131.1 hypothetical protein SAMN04489764_4935 [Thermostaphylospora chromogena]